MNNMETFFAYFGVCCALLGVVVTVCMVYVELPHRIKSLDQRIGWLEKKNTKV